MKPYHPLSQSWARWTLEVDIDEYHHLIPVCLLGLTVLEKMQCQNNTDNQIIVNESNKCFPPSVLTLPPHRGGQIFFCKLRALLEILWLKSLVCHWTVLTNLRFSRYINIIYRMNSLSVGRRSSAKTIKIFQVNFRAGDRKRLNADICRHIPLVES